MKTQLFLEGLEIEINDDIQFAITNEFSNVEEPANIYTSWSKTISVPATVHNNLIFGNLFRADRKYTKFSDPYGISFNVHRKLSMKLIYNNTVLMNGYAKMSQVVRNSGKTYYEMNLFGELGKVFGELQKITFDPAETEEGYIIDGTKYFNSSINKECIYKVWNEEQDNTVELSSANYDNIIGFTPLNTYYDDFDHSTHLADDASTVSLSDTLSSHWETSKLNTDIDAESLIGDGILPRAMGEFRSYYQLPFIFFNKFFEIFKDKAEEVTDYSIDFSNTWKENSYYKDLVFLGKQLYEKNASKLTNNFTLDPSTHTGTASSGYIADPIIYNSTTSYRTAKSQVLKFKDISDPSIYDASNNLFVLTPDENIRLEGAIPMRILVSEGITSSLYFRNDVRAELSVKITGANGYSELMTTNYVFNEDTTLPTALSENVNIVKNAASISVPPMANTYYWDIPFNYTCLLQYSKFGSGAQISVNVKWNEIGSTTPFPFNIYGEDTGSVITYVGLLESYTMAITKLDGEKRSQDMFTINDIWDNETTPFDMLLNYTKRFNLMFDVDDVNKKITIMPKTEYFSKYTIEDWSEKVDYSQDYTLSPVRYGHKYMVLNYEDNDTNNGANYLSQYGINYGSIRINTNDNFNNDSEDVFDKGMTSIEYTPTYLDWDYLYNLKFVYLGLLDKFVYLNDEDNNKVDSFGSFFFYRGIRKFDLTSEREIYITDDTKLQIKSDTYMFINTSKIPNYAVKTEYYSYLDIVDEDRNICLMNRPMKTYDSGDNYSDVSSIYDKYWKDWINERYNSYNNILTCYVKIKPNDYINFKFRNFVIIDHILYMINKIYDYSPNNLLTKVEMILITDIKSYTE